MEVPWWNHGISKLKNYQNHSWAFRMKQPRFVEVFTKFLHHQLRSPDNAGRWSRRRERERDFWKRFWCFKFDWFTTQSCESIKSARSTHVSDDFQRSENGEFPSFTLVRHERHPFDCVLLREDLLGLLSGRSKVELLTRWSALGLWSAARKWKCEYTGCRLRVHWQRMKRGMKRELNEISIESLRSKCFVSPGNAR